MSAYVSMNQLALSFARGANISSSTVTAEETKSQTTVAHEVKIQRHWVIYLDVSGSMSGSKIKELKQCLVKIYTSHMVQDGDLVTIKTFSNEIKPLAIAMQVAMVDVASIVPKIRAGGMTPLYDAIADGLAIAERAKKANRNLVTELIVFTDGADSSSRLSLQEVIKKVAKPGFGDFNLM